MLDCIRNTIIGLSDTECDCWENLGLIDYNESDSGLFITDLIDVNDIALLKDCNSQEIWKILDKVRSFGLNKFKSNMERIVLKNFSKTIPDCTCRNRMYQTSYQSKNHTGQYVWKGVEITSKNQKGSFARLEKIVTYFKANGTVDVKLFKVKDYDNYIGGVDAPELLSTITLTIVDGKVVNDIDNIQLDLYTGCADCNDLRYYLVYEALVDNSDNKCFCGCAGGKCYTNFVKLEGVYFDSEQDFLDGNISKRDNYCNGLELYMDFVCDWSKELCEDEELNYEQGLHRAYAEAVLYESILYLLTLIDSRSTLSSVFSYNASFKSDISQSLTEVYSYIIDTMKAKEFNCIACKGKVKHT